MLERAPTALLDGVRSLVAHQRRIIGARTRAEDDVRAKGERARADFVRRFRGRGIAVNPYASEVCAKTFYDAGANCRRCGGAEGAGW